VTNVKLCQDKMGTDQHNNVKKIILKNALKIKHAENKIILRVLDLAVRDNLLVQQ